MKSDQIKGFTLLEIVVALAILGVGLATTMQIFSGGLKNIYRLDLAHRAMNHAENVMNQILSDELIIESTRLSGSLDEDFGYTAAVDYWQDPREQLALDTVTPTTFLLSVSVDIYFKNDPRGKLYRTVCLKTVAVPDLSSSPLGANQALRQLVGRGR